MKEKLIDLLKTLRLRGMAAALDDSLTALSQKKLAPTSWLEQLLHAEIARDKRRAEAKARWEALSPEERAQKLAKMVPFAAKHDGAGLT